MFIKLAIGISIAAFFSSTVLAERPPAGEEQYGTFVGCASGSFEPGEGYGLPGTYDLAENCALACNYDADKPYTWSYFRDGIGSCTCSNTYYPLTSTAAQPAEFARMFQCADGDYTVWVSSGTYSTNACYSRQEYPEGESTLQPMGQVYNPEECLQQCIPFNYASTYLQGDADGATLFCYCGAASDYYGAQEYEVACNFNTYTIYQHITGTSVNSQFAKRQLKERMIRTKGKKRALCPGSLTACNVAGVSDSFECIDTTQELESCGGCAAGEYNRQDAIIGVDCTALPGVPRGAITCSNSRCNAFACKSGWSLASNGTCVEA